jgi:hypothetical protein
MQLKIVRFKWLNVNLFKTTVPHSRTKLCIMHTINIIVLKVSAKAVTQNIITYGKVYTGNNDALTSSLKFANITMQFDTKVPSCLKESYVNGFTFVIGDS